MMAMADEHYLTSFLEERHKQITKFLAEYSDLSLVLDTAVMLGHSLAFSSTLDHGADSVANTYCGLMWQTAANYQRQSLIHILAKELDEGFALLRMATELARDANIIGRDEKKLELWQKREEQLNAYRQVFKFDRSSPAGEFALSLYKLSSRLGVHGHSTSLIHARTREQLPEESRAVLLSADESAIFAGLQIWLRSLFPIHTLFIEAFHFDGSTANEPVRLFLDFVDNLQPVLNAIDKRVKEKGVSR